MFYGKGAGKLPTASAVVADIIDCVKHFKARKYLYWEDGAEQYVLPYEDSVISVYLRGHADVYKRQRLPFKTAIPPVLL